MASPMPMIGLPSGDQIPVLGQGTWHFAEVRSWATRCCVTSRRARDVFPVQIALAWVLRVDNLCAIPRAGTPEHVCENRATLDVELTQDELAALDAEFPPPLHARPLEML